VSVAGERYLHDIAKTPDEARRNGINTIWLEAIGDKLSEADKYHRRLWLRAGATVYGGVKKSSLSRLRRTTARERSWNGLGCAAILLTISTILGCRKVIHSEGMSFTYSIRAQFFDHKSP
jgi:hypothetical protein